MKHDTKQLLIAVAVCGGVLALALGQGLGLLPKGHPDCIERGEAFFKEIGSWPRLRSTGDDAAAVVRERCARSLKAF